MNTILKQILRIDTWILLGFYPKNLIPASFKPDKDSISRSYIIKHNNLHSTNSSAHQKKGLTKAMSQNSQNMFIIIISSSSSSSALRIWAYFWSGL